MDCWEEEPGTQWVMLARSGSRMGTRNGAVGLNTASETNRDRFDNREDSTEVFYNGSDQDSDSKDNRRGEKWENKRAGRHHLPPTFYQRGDYISKKTTSVTHFETGQAEANELAC